MMFLKSIIGKRVQLFEIQDYPWCPKAVRDGITDLLVLNLKILPLYEPAIPWLVKFSKKTNGQWVDLCAGAGGGSILLKDKMPGQIKELILTDLYPHSDLNKTEGVTFYPHSVDACNVPKELIGFRTLFTSFHHLEDKKAFEVLKNARDSKVPIGVFEFTERSLFCLLLMLPSFFTSFFLIPFVKPFKLSRLFWTYVIPLIPLITLVDILLSCFRTRSTHELNKFVNDLKSHDYVWEIGKLPTYVGLSITYIVGYPND